MGEGDTPSLMRSRMTWRVNSVGREVNTDDLGTDLTQYPISDARNTIHLINFYNIHEKQDY